MTKLEIAGRLAAAMLAGHPKITYPQANQRVTHHDRSTAETAKLQLSNA